MGSLIGRLIIGPLIALSLIYLFHIDGVIAQSSFIFHIYYLLKYKIIIYIKAKVVILP